MAQELPSAAPSGLPAVSAAPTAATEMLAARLLRRAIDVRPEEVAALGWSWLYIFSVLSSYYIMRPIRDQMGIAGGVNNLQWLFTGTLAGMLLLNLPYAWLVRTLPRRRFIAITYRFFAVNILLFALALHLANAAQAVWLGRFFFIWTSVYNLFVVSVFWAMIVDVFNSEQGKRLFGFIAAGATIGAIVGSGVTASLAEHVAPTYLLLGAAGLLEVAVFGVRHLSRLSDALRLDPRARAAGSQPIGGGVLSGISHAFRSRYLVNVSVFLLLFSLTSTLLYFQQASIDLAVNVLTLGVQLFLTGRIVRWLGVGITLALLPGVSVIGFGALAMLPSLWAVIPFQVLRRAGNFAVARPTREVLFTVVPREDRYKAKNFIDTVIYRIGDQVGAWSYALLAALGWGMTRVAVVAVPLSAIWLLVGLWLGRRQETMAAHQAGALASLREAPAPV